MQYNKGYKDKNKSDYMKSVRNNIKTGFAVGAIALSGLVSDYAPSIPKESAEDNPSYVINLGSTEYQMKEGETQGIRVYLSNAPESGFLTINYECSPLGNITYDDFFPSKGQISFPKGIKEGTINITANKDFISEADESFEVRLSSDRDDVNFETNKTIVTIKGDAVSSSGNEAPRCGCNGSKGDYIDYVRKAGKVLGLF